MKLAYKRYCTVSLLHDYYANGKLNAFTLSPTAETEEQMRNLNIIWRVSENKLVLLVLIREDGTPAADIEVASKLSFYFQASEGRFYNVTCLSSFTPDSQLRYRWTNVPEHLISGIRYLNSPVPSYDSTLSYDIGSLASESSTVYEAIQSSNAGDPHTLADDAWWMSRGDVQPVNDTDLVPYTSREQKPLGIIELNNTLAIADSSGVFVAPDIELGYSLQFISRSVLWKYNTIAGITAVTDDAAGAAKMVFAPAGLQQFISQKPGPLREGGRPSLSLTTAALEKIQPIPAPAGTMLGRQSGSDYLYAETTLIY